MEIKRYRKCAANTTQWKRGASIEKGRHTKEAACLQFIMHTDLVFYALALDSFSSEWSHQLCDGGKKNLHRTFLFVMNNGECVFSKDFQQLM